MHIKRFISAILAIVFFQFFSMNLSADGEEAIPAAANVEITSKAAILMEASTGQILYEKDAHTMLPIGTLNKIMTTLLVAEAIDSGKLSLTDEITASARANSMKQAVIWLKVGEKMTVDDLLKAVIIGNANDAAVALAEAVSGTEDAFVKRMNTRAEELGMSGTVFKNCTGYDEENQGSTAYEVALMSRELLKHEFLYPYMTCWLTELRGGETSVVNANVLVKSYEGIIGVKAGHSEAAGNCLVSAAERDGNTYLAVILGSADKDSRFREAKYLMNSAFSNYQIISPTIPSEVFQAIPVTHGVTSEVGIRTESLSSIVIRNGTLKDLRTEVLLPKRLTAPVYAGQVIGEIAFYHGDTLIYKKKLMALSDVEKLTPCKAFVKLFKNAFEF